MQTEIKVSELRPLGTNVLLKREPEQTHVRRIEIPEEYRDRNNLNGGMLFTGIAIAVGSKTKAARFGRDRGWFEPGDRVWAWSKWDWKDHEIVLKDSNSGDDYLVINEGDIYAYEISGDA